MNKFSIIIPTMWFPECFKESILEILNSKLVEEIIIIDNNPDSPNKFEIDSKKIKLLTKNQNIFVNPSWNLGVKTSKTENIILLNDDIVIKNLDLVLLEINKSSFDLIGLDLENLNKEDKITIRKNIGFRNYGFGCFMFIKKNKYFEIPENIKIWYGDDILFLKVKNSGIISFSNAKIEVSKTIKMTSSISEKIIHQDKLNYREYLKNENKHRPK